MNYKLNDIETLMNSESTKDLLALIDKHQNDPALLDSLIIALEMMLVKYPPDIRQQIRAFAFADATETEQ